MKWLCSFFHKSTTYGKGYVLDNSRDCCWKKRWEQSFETRVLSCKSASNKREIRKLVSKAFYDYPVEDYIPCQYHASQNLLGIQGLVRDNLCNNQLQWEKVFKLMSRD